MNRLVLLLALVVTAACGGVTTTTPSPVSPPDTHNVEAVAFPNGGSGFIAVPKSPGKHAAILLVPEWWGVTPWLEDDAGRFAALGYVALVVDLYRGRKAATAAEAHELSRGLSDDRALADMKAAFESVGARPDVDPTRIGAIGWCMGGGYALELAVAEPRLKAMVMNYGKLVSAPEKIAAIHAAVLGNFAGQDRGIAATDVRAFADALKAAHKDADIKIYDSAKHAFMNPTNKDTYDPGATEDAWSRIDAFYARTLAP
jgi:carboxymethylenebutenolidase